MGWFAGVLTKAGALEVSGNKKLTWSWALRIAQSSAEFGGEDGAVAFIQRCLADGEVLDAFASVYQLSGREAAFDYARQVCDLRKH